MRKWMVCQILRTMRRDDGVRVAYDAMRLLYGPMTPVEKVVAIDMIGSDLADTRKSAGQQLPVREAKTLLDPVNFPCWGPAAFPEKA